VCILPEKAIPKMTYTVSGGMFNPTHSLTLVQNLKYCLWLEYSGKLLHITIFVSRRSFLVEIACTKGKNMYHSLC